MNIVKHSDKVTLTLTHDEARKFIDGLEEMSIGAYEAEKAINNIGREDREDFAYDIDACYFAEGIVNQLAKEVGAER